MELQISTFADQTDFGVAENVIPLCELAKGFEEAGEFEQAAETLKPFWKNLGERPSTDGLATEAKAELLLRSGALTGWLGSGKQLSGAQELAKDLISESATLFTGLGLNEKVAEARVDLAICYWREGALDEARVTLRHVLDSLGDQKSEQWLRAVLNIAIVEKVATREIEALKIYREAAPQFDLSTNHALKGKFHNSHATLLKTLGLAESREDYLDTALVEFTAASFHFEQAGHKRFQGRVENNVGFLFASIGRFDDAQGCEDTRAQAYMLEGKYSDAARVAASAVRNLTQGGEQSLLAEALTTQGRALARSSNFVAARASLDQAIDVSQRAGDPDRGGIAAVSAIEELSTQLNPAVVHEYYRTAEVLLAKSQNRGLKIRLGECARKVLSTDLAPVEQAPGDQSFLADGFSLDAEVLRYEGNLIRQALEASGGSVTRAARMLGVTHQGLAFILNGRHNNLLSIRTPVKRRRKSIIRYH
ncbi:MAG: hypothetical protein DMF69_24160 [Acidobacteria bacterium]|nr:MAG: hypothetical protein DMF69_24160 [Acidobacteriota bacterium]